MKETITCLIGAAYVLVALVNVAIIWAIIKFIFS
jgi:nitrogen fixation-related uncharacterized protein